MNFSGRYLDDPLCVFKNGVEYRGSEFRYRGLRQSGPYDSHRVPENPRFLFVFPQEFRTLANSLYHGLRSGNNQFPGMAAMFGVNLTPAQLKSANKFTVEQINPREASARYSRAIAEFLNSENAIDFAVVLCQKTLSSESPSPYYAAKAALAAHDIPSQAITVDTLSNPNQLSWSIGNIGLQIFVKLGGQPWFVRPSAGGGDVIVGIGRSERMDEQGKIIRYVGYTTAYNSGGVFKSIEVFEPHNSIKSYLDGFQSSMVAALKGVIGNTDQPLRLVMHVPKTFSWAERERLEAALKYCGEKIAGYVILRISDEHPFHLFDISHTSFAPISGLSVEMDHRNRLLLLEGRPATGNMRRSPPLPIWVTHQVSSTTEPDLDALVQQIYELSVANWRGFNAKARPITTYYSTLIARILSSSDSDELIQGISSGAKLKEVPWFI